MGVEGSDKKLETASFCNLFWGASFALGFCVFAICPGVCNFALVRIFGTPQTISLAFAPKIPTNTKATPPLLRLFVVFCLWNSASFGGLRLVKGERILLLAKAKRSKSFFEILRCRIKGGFVFCVRDSADS